ncbi:MAG: bile acid:sodium symporter [Verrucomicrobiota bacterium]|nr:bile acid:sodium symporter [Verrucomicrobiota bacterium]
MNLLSTIKKHLIIVIPITMILGFVFGINVDAKFLKITILPLTFLMVYPMMVNLQLKKIFEGGDTKVQLVTQFINFAIVPFIAYGFGRFFFPDNHYLALGLLLAGLLPTSGMTISWTGMAKGNMPAAVKMTVLGLILGSILTPFYVKILMGTTVSINMAKVFMQIGTIVVIPLILGNITQRILISKYGLAHYNEKLKKIFPSFSTLGVVGIVFVAMALKAKGIMANPSILLTILLPLTLFYVVNIIISIVVGRILFKRGNAIALLYGTVMRNLSIALAIAMTAFGKEGSDIALVIALGYIIQVQLAAWVVKLTTQIYGSAPEDDASQIMHYGLFSLHEIDTLKQAVMLLAEEDIHSLVILNKDEMPVGMLTLEKTINFIADNYSMNTLLSELELEEVLLAGLHQPVSAIAKTMNQKHEYKVLITNKKGVVEGVVTAQDILKDLA